MRLTASSAVLSSWCSPLPLQRVTCSGTEPRMLSTPLLRLCSTFSLGIFAIMAMLAPFPM